MHILFVTRKYPPSTGGMQNAAYELYKSLAITNDVTLIKWGGANKALPVIYPLLFIRALIKGLANKPDVIYLQDGIMAPMGSMLRLLLRRPTVITIHGKEATYGNPIYKMIIPPFVRKQNVLVAVSKETEQTVRKAIPGTKPLVIFNGVSDSYYSPQNREAQFAAVASAVGMPLDELRTYKLLHTNGRLVRRKGVLWFIDEVMPKLVAERPVLYLVSGDGKDRELIQAAIEDKGLQHNVRMLGRVSDELLRNLYNVADLFVMPNIPVPNDMEGFGLVALEAASCGTPVVASKLEGIQDAIIDRKNGFLIPPTNSAEYVRVISRELYSSSLPKEAVRGYTLDHYSWVGTAHQYEEIMRGLTRKRS
jgi:glycosyltransferase involved in cell wall biosynthesis